MICRALLFLGILAGPVCAAGGSDVERLVEWLLQDGRNLEKIPFPEVIRAASGCAVLPVDKSDSDARRVLDQLGTAAGAVLREMNAPDSAARKAGRINEASRSFEDAVRVAVDAMPGLRCAIPPTRDGRAQRSGYPDLRVLDEATGHVYYVDVKLFAEGSRDSSFRTFYYEPKRETGKVLEDAVHLILGFEHQASDRFVRWEIIDLSGFKVRFKAEFEAGNRDLYRPDAVVGSGTAD